MSSSSGYNVAIVGATGAVGEALLEILQERKFPVAQLYLLALSDPQANAYSFTVSLCKCSA